jgi:hypothetical protein
VSLVHGTIDVMQMSVHKSKGPSFCNWLKLLQIKKLQCSNRSCCGPSKMVLGCVCWNFRFYQQSLSLEFFSLYEKVTERHLFAINHEQLKGIWTYSLGKMVIHCCHSWWCHINKLGCVTWFLNIIESLIVT